MAHANEATYQQYVHVVVWLGLNEKGKKKNSVKNSEGGWMGRRLRQSTNRGLSWNKSGRLMDGVETRALGERGAWAGLGRPVQLFSISENVETLVVYVQHCPVICGQYGVQSEGVTEQQHRIRFEEVLYLEDG